MSSTEMVGISEKDQRQPPLSCSAQTANNAAPSLEQKYEALRWELVEYKQQAHYWEALYKQLQEKQVSLEREFEELKAKLRQREQQLFGKHSEQTQPSEKTALASTATPKPRGQQSGSQGHGRREHDHLPVVEETLEIHPEDARCPCCQLPYEVLPGTEDSEVLDIINVRAYRRVIHRKVYKRHCECVENRDAQIVMAPPLERVIPKSKLGISIWSHLLLSKYGYQQPLYRCLKQLADMGLSLAQGTVTEGLQKLLPLFVPVYDAIVKHSLAAGHWHADETGWKVFEATENKKDSRWYLWVLRNTETVVYKIAESRSSQVLKAHFGKKHPGGTFNVDRYSAYKSIAKSGLFVLAFCWSHVRRDFLNYSKSHPEQQAWGLSWVETINRLYHVNNQRHEHRPGSQAFQQQDKLLKDHLSAMQEKAKAQQHDKTLLPSAKKLLISLEAHWEGLTVFSDRPNIPMDNNAAERSLRNPVVGRKNYYGSGSVWSAELAAALFTLFETLKLWKINLQTWLLAYLQDCAMAGGEAPINLRTFLPWQMTAKQKELFSKLPQSENSS